MTKREELEKFRDYYARNGNPIMAGIYQVEIDKLD